MYLSKQQEFYRSIK